MVLPRGQSTAAGRAANCDYRIAIIEAPPVFRNTPVSFAVGATWTTLSVLACGLIRWRVCCVCVVFGIVRFPHGEEMDYNNIGRRFPRGYCVRGRAAHRVSRFTSDLNRRIAVSRRRFPRFLRSLVRPNVRSRREGSLGCDELLFSFISVVA